MVVAGLLFLAFAYLAVGQAAANRNGAQTAADAAALAAALDTRDALRDEWVDKIADPTAWQAVFDGGGVPFDGCARATQLAAQNEATAHCVSVYGLPPGYTVDVKANESVGDSIVPGTEDTYSKATATAVIESRCSFPPPAGDAGDAGDEGDPGDADENALPTLTCKGSGEWILKPDDLADLPKPEDLFDVHLAD
jgi:hypothetical protein